MNLIRTYFLAALAFVLLACGTSHAQQDEICLSNRTAPPANSWHWEPDATIKLYFQQNMFTPEQQQALLETIDAWNVVARNAGSGIKLVYAGETLKSLDCENCLTVAHGEIQKFDKKHYAFFYPIKRNDAGLVLSAWIIFDVGITKPKALRSYMAHELGHGMGLWDCQECRKSRTIMNAFPGVNKDNGLLAPSPCDQFVVQRVYEQYRKLTAIPAGQPSPSSSGN
jgi:hypothetical protein